MRAQPPTIQTMNISAVKSRLNSLINDIYRGETRILVEKSGIPVAALVPVSDLRRLEHLDAQDRDAWDVLEAMRAPFRDVPVAEIERETERILAEIRAEDRANAERTARSA
jgi:prevent-host-death family protein